MVTILLTDLLFYAYHGVHDEERIIGCNYVVSAEIDFEEKGYINELDQTINYGSIFAIIKRRMEIPVALLETFTMDAGNDIYNSFPFVKRIKIIIVKNNPPIAKLQGNVGVSWQKVF